MDKAKERRVINRTTLLVIIINLCLVFTKWHLGINVVPYLIIGSGLVLGGDLILIGLQMYLLEIEDKKRKEDNNG